jgi:ABC-type multidrug transport system fused ATPase/permease subunit|tara:strand:+ start:1627 stop:3420 length:1794 start_codon:yes stop_codon:yes gene_type:complete
VQNIKKLLYLFSGDELKRALLLLIMTLIMAIIDMIGVASILPFIAVLTNSEIIETNKFLNLIYNYSNIFGIETEQQFLFFLGICVFLILIVSISFKALTSYAQVRFTIMREYSLAKRLVEGYLHQPYTWFLNRHSASLSKNILTEASRVINKGLSPIINLITQIIVTLSLIILLSIVNLKITLIITATLGISYILIYTLNKNLLKRIGEKIFRANEKRFTSLTEAFGATKEIKVSGLEQVYLKKFTVPAKSLAMSNALETILNQLPRYILEIIAFGGMILFVLFLMSQSSDITHIIPLLALYAFAGYRLMPSLQLIYSSFSQLQVVGPPLESIYNDLKKLEPKIKSEDKNVLKLKDNLSLNNVYFNYPNSKTISINDLSLIIPAFNTVGIVGSTGSGKTTTVDIILNLLEAQQGTLKVDGQIINKLNQRAWQRSIGYVPQQIFLIDDTIAANIAFGVEIENIDQKAVERAARIAKLEEFIINELPSKYKTKIGERGVRLSGGQKQRLGIARALYHNPQLLIFDEATSALDNLTEQAVMESINSLRNEITIIMIAHRLSTVKQCDKIFYLEKGRIKAQGTFKELINISDFFREDVKNS